MDPKRIFKGLEALIWGLAAVTMFFSAVYIFDMLPSWVPVKWLIAGAISLLLTKAWHILYRYKLRIRLENEWLLWFPIAAISLTTVWGTVSTFHEQVVRNTLESEEYQNLQRERSILQDRLEKQIRINHVTRSHETSQEIAVIDGKMEVMRTLGAGAGNSIYTTVAELTGWSVTTIALIRLIFFAVLLDTIILILMKISETIHDAALKDYLVSGHSQNKITPPTPPSANTAPVKKDGQNGADRWLTKFVGVADPRPFLDLANEKIKHNKTQRMAHLASYIAKNPNASLSEMAKAIGVSSRETVRRYLKEMKSGDTVSQQQD